MPARTAIPRVGWLALVVLGQAWAAVGSPPEFRGLWVDGFHPGFFNAEQVKKLAADCRKYNFNAVLVEMRRRGDAFYDSRFDPRTTAIPTNFDALSEIIKECHTGNPRIEVHCWVVSHFIWAWKNPPDQPEHVFNRHPEYLTKDSIGQTLISKGYYLDPGNPDANLTIHNVARDIVSRYDIDGLHWDYCRYPTRDSGYNETALRRYNAEFGLTGQPTPNDPRFSEWRRRQVSDFLRWVNADLWELKPQLVISVSVFANIEDSFGYRFADWPGWTRAGLVDACMPMDFAADNRNIFCPRADKAIKHREVRQVYVGQGAYMNTKENTLWQMRYLREKGFAGEAFYSYGSPSGNGASAESVLSYLKEEFQPAWADTPPLPWKHAEGIIKGTVLSEERGPIYNASVRLNTGQSQKTEPHGSFAFFDLNPGRYFVTAQSSNSPAITASVTINPGEVKNLALMLKH